jgi:hypothetical protein
MFTKVDETVRDVAMKIKNDPELNSHIPKIIETVEELTLKKEYTSLTNKEESILAYFTFILKHSEKN